MPDSALAVFDRAAGLAPHQGNQCRTRRHSLRNGCDSAFRAEARAAILSEDLDFDRKAIPKTMSRRCSTTAPPLPTPTASSAS